jgi:serine/threonine protein phosphatase PrpC
MRDKSDETVEESPLVGPAEAEPPTAFSSLVRLEVGALSHPGKVRPTNEDHFLAASYGRTMRTLKTNLPDGSIPDRFDEMGYALAVADGIGGAAAGEIASSLALTVGVNLTLNNPKWNLRMTPEEAQEHVEKVRHRFRQIDQIMTERARSVPDLAGMGTTLTLASSVGDQLFLYHVGDSRAYLFRGGLLRQLTHDHTQAQALADAGWIDPAAVATHRLRHILTRALGSGGGDVEVEYQHLALVDDDRLLLCSDGLSDMVPDARIAEVLRRPGTADDACAALMELALDAGGKDNVTVVLARYALPARVRPDAVGDGRPS